MGGHDPKRGRLRRRPLPRLQMLLPRLLVINPTMTLPDHPRHDGSVINKTCSELTAPDPL